MEWPVTPAETASTIAATVTSPAWAPSVASTVDTPTPSWAPSQTGAANTTASVETIPILNALQFYNLTATTGKEQLGNMIYQMRQFTGDNIPFVVAQGLSGFEGMVNAAKALHGSVKQLLQHLAAKLGIPDLMEGAVAWSAT